MRVLGVIPARWGSSRFPGKPMALIQNRPMIQWVIEGARTSQILHEVVVATDDERIARAAQAIQCRVVMTSSDLPSGTDRIYRASQNIGSDIILNIQGDEPLINKDWIDPLALALIANANLAMATLAHPISELDLHNLNAVKVLVDQNSNAIYFSRLPIPFSRLTAKDIQSPVPCFKHIGMYAYRADFLRKFCEAKVSACEQAEALEQLRALDLGEKIKVIFVEKPTLGVDTPEDLIKVEKWLEGLR